MKYKIISHSFMVLSALLVLISCNKKISVTEPDPPGSNSSFYIETEPAGAAILLNGLNTGKVTPDSVVDIEPGQYTITLKLDPFIDVNIDTSVAEDSRTNIFYNYLEDDRNYGFADVDDDIRYVRAWQGPDLIYQWPEEVNLYINDSLYDEVLPKVIKLWPGTYTFRETASEHRSDEETVNIRGGVTTEVRLTLQDTSVSVDYNSLTSDFPAIRTSCVEVDHNGTVWIGNYPGGVAKYQNGEFTYYNSDNSPMLSNVIICMTVDNNNTKWIGTKNGLLKIDANENWELFTTDNSQIASNYIDDITVDGDDIWIAAGDPMNRRCLIKYDGNQWTVWDAPENRLLLSLAMDQNKLLWVGLDMGITTFDGSNWLVPDSLNSDQTDVSLRVNPIQTIEVGANNKVWFGVGTSYQYIGGLYYYNGKLFHKHSIELDQVAHISKDINGDLWVTPFGYDNFSVTVMDGKAVFKIDANDDIKYYQRKTELKAPTALYFDAAIHPNGDLWIASKDKGIIKVKLDKLDD